MSLEKILERIERDAQGEVDEINKRASAAESEIINKAKEEAEALKAKMMEEAKEEAEQRKERLISTARLDLRKDLLAEKQEAINAAFEKAIDDLLSMDINKYRGLIRNMIVANVQTGDEEIILSERDKSRLGKNFLRDVNSRVADKGKKGRLTMSRETYNMAGGFVLRRGKIELNSSFESLFKSSRDELESEVSRILFPES